MTSRSCPFLIWRSRKGCPGQAHSSRPLSSRSTARNTRRPRRVGRTPVVTTRATHVTSSPTRARASGVTAVASRYRCGAWYRRSPTLLTPSRASASARFGPTPFRYFTAVVSSRATNRPPPVHLIRSLAHQAPRVARGVEHLQIVEPFARAQDPDRHGHRAFQGDHAAALRGPVDLCCEQTGEPDRGGECLCLMRRVLAGGAVKREQRFLRRCRLLL